MNMPRRLPDDIWLQVIEIRPLYDPPDLNFLHNLALTCRRLHQIATPVLYKFLRFYVDFCVEDDIAFEVAMIGLIRDLNRAKSLLQSPHLLRHVQHLTLEQWDDPDSHEGISLQYFPSGDDLDTRNARNMTSSIYDLISRLVLHMPRLQQLVMLQSPMTPLLYAAMRSRPRLASFSFDLMDTAKIHAQSRPIGPPQTLGIRKLQYHNEDADERADWYLPHILHSCIMNLDTLSILWPHLPFLQSLVFNRTVPLKTLRVQLESYHNPDDDDAPVLLWDILRATPDLQTLVIRVSGLRQDVPPPPDDFRINLCNMSQLSATPMTVRKLAEGKELDKIEIIPFFPINGLSITQIVPCSPTHLREITLAEVQPKTQDELTNFISSFHVFQCLEYLKVGHSFPDSPVTHADLFESWNVLKELWRQLKHLHTFVMYKRFSGRKYEIEVACPVDLDDGHSLRGHPTLERLRVSFLGQTSWEFNRDGGWVPSVRYNRDSRTSWVRL